MRKLNFVSLQVSDLEQSKAFYTGKLGFEALPAPNPDACLFAVGNGEVSFAIRKPIGSIEGKQLGTGLGLWFATDKTAEALQAELAEKGVALVGGITPTPFGQTLVVQDPDGYQLTFVGAAAGH